MIQSGKMKDFVI